MSSFFPHYVHMILLLTYFLPLLTEFRPHERRIWFLVHHSLYPCLAPSGCTQKIVKWVSERGVA